MSTMVVSVTKDENVAVNEQPRQPTESSRRMRALNRRLRIAFIAGAEERSRRELGRPLNVDELRRILARYPDDLPEKG